MSRERNFSLDPQESPDNGLGGNTTDKVNSPEPVSDMTFAMIAPGQGGQRVGMGGKLAEKSDAAKNVWNMAERIFGKKEFMDIVREGPEEALNRTDITQPAVVVDTLARKAALDEAGIRTNAGRYTGLSLGFVSSIALAGAFANEEDALYLIKARGDATLAAYQENPSKMVALKDVPAAFKEEIQDAYGLELCLDNTDRQQVFGGSLGDVDKAIDWLTEQGFNNGQHIHPLDIGGAFHSSYMQPAVEIFRHAVENAHITAPQQGILIGISTGEPITTPEGIREELLRQLVTPVRWRDVVRNMRADGVAEMIELNEIPRLTDMNVELLGGEKKRITYPGDIKLPIAYTWRAAA